MKLLTGRPTRADHEPCLSVPAAGQAARRSRSAAGRARAGRHRRELLERRASARPRSAADRLTGVRPAGLPIEAEADLHDLSRLARTALEQGQDPREVLSLDEIKLARDTEASLVFRLAPISPGMRHARQRERLAELRSSGTARLWRFWSVLYEAAQRGGPLQQIVLRRNVPNRSGELQDRIEVYWRATWRLPDVPVDAARRQPGTDHRREIPAAAARRAHRRQTPCRDRPGGRYRLQHDAAVVLRGGWPQRPGTRPQPAGRGPHGGRGRGGYRPQGGADHLQGGGRAARHDRRRRRPASGRAARARPAEAPRQHHRRRQAAARSGGRRGRSPQPVRRRPRAAAAAGNLQHSPAWLSLS